ncbi:type IV secretion system protein TraC [Thiolapillus sp.]|nr:type IV secretion system protein TraC [Thiolapillus sp.]
MLDRDQPQSLIPPLAYNPDSGLIFLDGGAIGACFIAPLMTGGDDITALRLETALASQLPKDSFVQVSLLSTRDIDPILERYLAARHEIEQKGLTDDQEEILLRLVDERIAMFREALDKDLIKGTGIRTNQPILLFSVKLPASPEVLSEQYPQEKLDETAELVHKITEAAKSAGLDLYQLNAQEYTTYLRRVFHPFAPLERWYDDDRLIRDQVLASEDDIEVFKEGFRIGDTYVSVLAVQHLPKRLSLLRLAHISGDPKGLDNQISIPYMVSTTIYYPDQVHTRNMVLQKSTAINYQAFGNMAKWVPKIGYKKEGIDILVNSMEQQNILCQVNMSVALFAKDRQTLARQTAMLKAYYHSLGLTMSEERYIGFPMFWNTLPLFPTPESIKNTHRYHTMGINHAVQFLPVIGDWSGTGGKGAMLLNSRRGQPALTDLYDSNTGYSAIISAESGGGKSFFVQRLITDYLSIGAKVWVIDTGRSMYKLCRLLQGSFIEFSETSKTCLNPFTLVTDIKEEMEFLTSLIAKMAAPNTGLDDLMLAKIQESIDVIWGKMGNQMTVTDLQEYLAVQEDPRLRDLASQLYPYTQSGNHGEWFDGDNNLEFDNNFVVLELDDLKSKPSLQKVVLMQLITRIQQEMFLQRDGRPKIVIIEEAGDLLTEESANSGGGDQMVARFLASGYRRARKVLGSYITVTQSLADIYQSPVGQAIADNSPNKYILAQNSEAIDRLRASKYLDLSDAAFDILKSVHTVPGRYAEVFIYTNNGWGVARHVENRFAQVVFSTKGDERDVVMRDIENGVPAEQAVRNFIANYG